MARKITKEELVSIYGVLNPDEYVNSGTSNLKFKCEDCGDIYTMSLGARKRQIKKDLNTCKKCSKKNGGLKIRVSKDELISFGVVNPDEYKGSNVKNLKFKCEKCDDIYTTSLGIRKNQMKKGLNTCHKCSMKNTGMKQRCSSEELVNIGLLNPNEYIDSKTKNLKFRCEDCNGIYITSLGYRKEQLKKGLSTCKSCSKKNMFNDIKKPTREELVSTYGVLNPDEYANNDTNNLKFKCSDCDDIYSASLSTRKNQIKRGLNTCKTCSKKNGALKKRMSKEELIKVGCLNPDDYAYSRTSNLRFKCSNDGCDNTIENRSLNEYVNEGNNRCPKCAKSISKPEIDLIEFLQSVGIKEEDIKSQARVLKREGQRPLELDIYLPKYNLAIEFHGDRYHSIWYKHSKNSDIVDKPKLKTLHHEKYLIAKEQNIRLIQIHEYEWRDDTLKEKLKSLIKHSLGKTSYKDKVYGRKCIVREIPKDKAVLFLDKYHLQGANKLATTCLGLFYNDELVAVTQFTSNTQGKNKDKHELIRHATNTNYLIIGALGKTLSYYKKNYHNKIYTFCDVEKFNGHSYIKAGFKETYFLNPDYCYVYNKERYHKFRFRKDKIRNRFPEIEFHDKMTENDMVKHLINNGYQIFKIYDAGKICFESC